MPKPLVTEIELLRQKFYPTILSQLLDAKIALKNKRRESISDLGNKRRIKVEQQIDELEQKRNHLENILKIIMEMINEQEN